MVIDCTFDKLDFGSVFVLLQSEAVVYCDGFVIFGCFERGGKRFLAANDRFHVACYIDENKKVYYKKGTVL